MNRRFKRVFAYFCRAAKVGRRPGAGARSFQEEEKRSRPAGPQMKFPFAAGGGEENYPARISNLITPARAAALAINSSRLISMSEVSAETVTAAHPLVGID